MHGGEAQVGKEGGGGKEEQGLGEGQKDGFGVECFERDGWNARLASFGMRTNCVPLLLFFFLTNEVLLLGLQQRPAHPHTRIYLPGCLPTYLPTRLCTYQSSYVHNYQSTSVLPYQPTYLFFYQPTHPPAHLLTCPPTDLHTYILIGKYCCR